jgi:pilus assembly protein CpaE
VRELRIVTRVRSADLIPGIKAAAATYRARLTHWTDAPISASELSDADLVVLEAAHSATAIQDFHVAKDACPRAEIVVLATANTTPEDVRRLFRAGARDVLGAPIAEDQLISAVGDAVGSRQSGQGDGLVVAVVKAAGGVGATTLAVNLAGYFANPPRSKRGDQPEPMKVALLDFDVQFGDLALALDLAPRKTVAEILRAPKRLDAHFLDGVMERHRSGVRVLAAPTGVAPLDALDGAVATSIVNVAASNHDIVILELPMAWSDWTGALMRRADRLLLVSSAAVRGVAGARRVLDAAAELNVSATRWSLVFNRLHGVLDGKDIVDQARRALEQPVIGSLSEDPAVRVAADRGRMIWEAAPNTRFAKDMRQLCAEIAQMVDEKHDPRSQSAMQR